MVLSILFNQYHACWYSGNIQSQDISRYGSDSFPTWEGLTFSNILCNKSFIIVSVEITKQVSIRYKNNLIILKLCRIVILPMKTIKTLIHIMEFILSLCPTTIIWWHRSWSTLAQILACWLTAKSQYRQMGNFGHFLSLHVHCISHVIWCWIWIVAYHWSYYVLWYFPYQDCMA